MEICGAVIQIFNHSTFCVRDKGHLGQHSDSNIVWEHTNERSNRDNPYPVSTDDDADNRAQ